jgi:hypothetical protein
MAYLRQVGSHPALPELSRLALAADLDAAASRWPDFLLEGTNAAGIAIPRFSPVREAAYAQVARAAVATVEGRRSDAERLLREVITAGLLVGDRGPTLIENLIGHVVAGYGGRALTSFYAHTGRSADAENVVWARQAAVAAAERAQVDFSPTALGVISEIPAVVIDTTALRGLRWEYFRTLNTVAPCLNVNRMIFGPDPVFAAWLEQAHASLVRWPSEEPLFQVMRDGLFGSTPHATSFLDRLLKATLRDDALGGCAAILRELDQVREIWD